ncbi:YwpF family protein [Bacillus haynesii]|uniref:YwpF family protein n=1 Tax=Bacillus haynesii TaxID=1925021 RepID=UPI00399057A3
MIELKESISTLLEGRLLTSKPLHQPEELLHSLLEQGLTGDDLMAAFKENIQLRKETTKL